MIDAGRWPHVRFRAMGCEMGALLDAPPEVAQAGLALMQPMMDAFERRFSRFRQDSELSRLNERPQQAVRVSPDFFEVVRQALALADATHGLFDPTLLDALEAAGYDRDFGQLPPVVFVAPRQRGIAPSGQVWRDVRLDEQVRTVSLPPGCRLDLGGIVKGWAAQRVARVLAHYGPCLVDAGGDLVAAGAPAGLPGWPVGLAAPGDTGQQILHFWLRDAAIATSGVDRRRWQVEGRTMHHLLDPRTGAPAQTDVVTATVIAPKATHAEAWAKASLLSGALEGASVLTAQDGLAGALLTDDGTLYFTSSMRRWMNAGW